jgi:hypothetical protein
VTLKGTDGSSDLANGGEAVGIALDNGKVYAVGLYYDGDAPMPCYWEGTTCHALALPAGVTTAYALSIAVSASGTVYAAGYYYDGNDSAIPCYWEGDTVHSLTGVPGTAGAYAYSIALSGSDVYVCGSCFTTKAVACYWKNADCVILDGPAADKSFPGFSYARSILVSDGKVYTAGYYDNGDFSVPCYWEGSSLHTLPAHVAAIEPDFQLSAIALSGGKVFVAGSHRTGKLRTPCYWEGDSFHDLVSGTPEGDIPFPQPSIG